MGVSICGQGGCLPQAYTELPGWAKIAMAVSAIVGLGALAVGVASITGALGAIAATPGGIALALAGGALVLGPPLALLLRAKCCSHQQPSAVTSPTPPATSPTPAVTNPTPPATNPTLVATSPTTEAKGKQLEEDKPKPTVETFKAGLRAAGLTLLSEQVSNPNSQECRERLRLLISNDIQGDVIAPYLRALLEGNGEQTYDLNFYGYNAFSKAVEAGNTKLVELLVEPIKEQFANTSEEAKPEDIFARAFKLALRNGHREIVDLLKCEVTLSNEHLLSAMRSGNRELVQTFIVDEGLTLDGVRLPEAFRSLDSLLCEFLQILKENDFRDNVDVMLLPANAHPAELVFGFLKEGQLPVSGGEVLSLFDWAVTQKSPVVLKWAVMQGTNHMKSKFIQKEFLYYTTSDGEILSKEDVGMTTRLPAGAKEEYNYTLQDKALDTALREALTARNSEE